MQLSHFYFPSLKKSSTAQNTVISSNFLVWKFCGKSQFPHSFDKTYKNLLIIFLSAGFGETDSLASGAATGGVLWRKMFLEISPNSQENTFLTEHLWRTPPYKSSNFLFWVVWCICQVLLWSTTSDIFARRFIIVLVAKNV